MLVITLLLGVFGVSAAGAFLWVRPGNARQEKFHLFRCDGCGQKLRYLASKAGRAGMCPRCRRQWTLPASAQAPPAAIQSCDGIKVKVGQRRVLTRSCACVSLR